MINNRNYRRKKQNNIPILLAILAMMTCMATIVIYAEYRKVQLPSQAVEGQTLRKNTTKEDSGRTQKSTSDSLAVDQTSNPGETSSPTDSLQGTDQNTTESQREGSTTDSTGQEDTTLSPEESSSQENTSKEEGFSPEEDSSLDTDASSPQTETNASRQVNPSDDPKDLLGNALFIGDSRTQGFQMHSGITDYGTLVYAHPGLTVDEIDSLSFINEDGTSKTLFAALQGKSFDKIFVMQGLNELGWPEVSNFKEKYKDFIGKIQNAVPGATIYVQSIIEVSKAKDAEGTYFSKEKVDLFNQAIQSLCDGTSIIYVDLNAYLADSEGYMKAEYASDGVHMTPTGYKAWLAGILDFLKN